MRVALLFLSTCMIGALPAQSVTGRVVGSDGLPVAHALVVLSGLTTPFTQRVVTTATGRFTINAPAPGSYALRLAAIGHTPSVISPITTVEGELRMGDLEISKAVVSLADLQVVAVRTSCGPRGGGSEVLGRLLDAARTSLEVMEAVTLQAGNSTRVENIRTRTTTIGRRTQQSADTASSVLVSWPIKSVSVDSLANAGFAVSLEAVGRMGREWYGPDARVLFDDRFLASHCFSIDTERSGEESVALVFEPASFRQGRVDIRGVLMIDPATMALQRMEFSHTQLPAGLKSGDAGGEMEFRQLPSGLWMPTSWRLFAPIETPDGGAVGTVSLSGRVLDGGVQQPRTRRSIRTES